MKLNTVIGINMMKYNFSVVARVLNDTWNCPHEYINQINQAKANKIKVNWPADKKLAYFAYEIHKKDSVGVALNRFTHRFIKFPKAKHVIHAK